MRLARLLLLCVLALPLPAVTAADSAELSPAARLVPGGGASRGDASSALGLGETRLPLASAGGLSVGTMSSRSLPFAVTGGPLAVGGYVAYGIGAARLETTVKSDGIRSGADLSASWNGTALGPGSIAALNLGVARSDGGQISPNRQQMGFSLADPYGLGGDINMSLSLIHQVTPSFSVGGVAAASRSNGAESPGTGLMLGAGLGYRF